MWFNTSQTQQSSDGEGEGAADAAGEGGAR